MKPRNLNRWVVFLCISFLLCSFSARASYQGAINKEGHRIDLNPRTGIILNEKEAPRVLDQCSRVTPKAERFWEPTEADVHQVNQQIIVFFNRDDVRKPTQAFEEYYRQYAGVWILDKKYIYVNFFNKATIDELHMSIRKAVSVCNGGDYFFGIVYNVKENAVQEVRYNSESE